MSNTTTGVETLTHIPHTHTDTGLTDSTHSSSASSASERYRLDDRDTRPVLLYKYRGALKTTTQKEICAELDKGKSCIHPQ